MAKVTNRDLAVMKEVAKDVQCCVDSGVSFAARLKSSKEIVGIRLSKILTENIPAMGPTEEMVSIQSI